MPNRLHLLPNDYLEPIRVFNSGQVNSGYNNIVLYFGYLFTGLIEMTDNYSVILMIKALNFK